MDEAAAAVDVAAAEMVAMAQVMDTVLQWIGFDAVATRNRLRDEGIS